MTTQPTYEEISKMAQDILITGSSDLADKYPDEYDSLLSEIKEIQGQGKVVSGLNFE